MADQYTRQNNAILKGQGGARYLITPAMTGVPAVGTVVTSGAGAWGAAGCRRHSDSPSAS